MFKVTILTLFCSLLAGSDTGELGVKIERNVPVPMRDGTILRADIHRPDRGGPYPVLVQRTPYGKDRLSLNRFVTAGYIVVNQDARGRYESEGKWESAYRFETHDAEDGYDTVEWAAKLPRSTGKVGTFGMSYDAFLQWRLAPLHPPSLMCMSAYMGGAASLMDAEGPAGIRPGIEPQWWARVAADMRRRENMPGVHTVWEARKLWQKDSEKWINWLPWLELPGDFFGYETDAAKHWLKNPHIDPWKLDEGIKEITVPNLDITGWYDYGNDDMLLFRTMIKEAKTEVARKGSRIIIGPWSHARRLQRRYGDIDFGPSADLDTTAVQIRWFDYWLKGKANGVDKDPTVRMFVMGDNKWRDEQHWPLRRAQEKTVFITSNGHANTPSSDGKLLDEKPKSVGTDNYVYDPRNPVPTPYGAAFPIAADQRSLAKREDILVYQTEPLTERIEVTGNPVVELYAASSAPDTDWFVRLIDVAPDGLARDASSGLVRARYRDGSDKPKLIKPNEVVQYTIRMSPTSNAFLPGHRIRLDITSSDFPLYERNHNTAADQNADASLAIAKQTIYHGGERATRIILPWVPNPIEEEPTEEEKPEPKPKKKMYQLHQAATDGDIEQVKLLISKGADVNAEDEEKKTPLHYAAQTGKKEVVQLIVEAGADVNAMGNNDWPPLCIAAGSNHIDVAEYLIAHGADVNPDNGWTPLQQAPYSSRVEMVELLIAKGADINAGEWTALHGAAGQGRRDIAELLIQKGADVNAKDEGGRTPLHWAISRDNNDVAKLLLAEGADFTWKNENALTGLHYAAVLGYRDIAELLLDKGSKVDERDEVYKFTALHYAARFGTKDVAEVLIANGANIKASDRWDYQPIHWAAYHDRPDIVELLIAKGADVNAKTSSGQTPLDLAKPRRNTKTIEVLRKYSDKTETAIDIKDANSNKSYVILERGDVRAVIVNNDPVDDEVLPGHRGGYSGLASLTHRARKENLFVPFYAGLNFEHIHDGTVKPRDILFEPRHAPMETRRIDQNTVELYQPPTPHWQLESWLRYQLLDDGAIEMTLDCIPRARTFKNDYIGLFFASYIDRPESLDIHFLGRPADDNGAEPRWIRGVTPEHGKLPTHLAVDDNRNFAHDPNFPLTLVFNKSNYRYTEPWYYGVSHGMALVLMFRPGDNVRLSQSPSGAGKGNPAWDFQWFVLQYKVGQRYRFVMRAMYLPFESREQIIRTTAPHRAALEQ